MTNAQYYGITTELAAEMAAAMDAAASEFWAYPDEEWQLAFEAEWLNERGIEAA